MSITGGAIDKNQFYDLKWIYHCLLLNSYAKFNLSLLAQTKQPWAATVCIKFKHGVFFLQHSVQNPCLNCKMALACLPIVVLF